MGLDRPGKPAGDSGGEGRDRAPHTETHPGAPHRPIGETLMSTVETAGTCTAILDELERAVVGRRRTLDLFFFRAEDGIRVLYVTGVQTCALPISAIWPRLSRG